jgi:hypothetical protein
MMSTKLTLRRHMKGEGLYCLSMSNDCQVTIYMLGTDCFCGLVVSAYSDGARNGKWEKTKGKGKGQLEKSQVQY